MSVTDPDQCIICLEPLVIQAPSLLPATALSAHHQHPLPGLDLAPVAAESPTTSTEEDTAALDVNSRIAALDSCDHVIHESCILLWAQKTNTCPICREQFRKLRVLDGISGTFVSTALFHRPQKLPSVVPNTFFHIHRFLFFFFFFGGPV